MFCCESVKAAYPSWHVQPSVCVTHVSGSECSFTVNIVTENLSEDVYCLYLQQQKLQCFSRELPQGEVKITLKNQSTLVLRDAKNTVILSHTLRVKSMTRQKQRQRIRSPWSVF